MNKRCHCLEEKEEYEFRPIGWDDISGDNSMFGGGEEDDNENQFETKISKCKKAESKQTRRTYTLVIIW